VFCLNFITGNPCPPPLDKINLPTGFKVEVFANVPRARTMVFNDDKSVLFVGTWINNLYAVDVASRQVTLVKTGLDMPNGVTYFNGTLFVAETQAITRYDNVMSTFPTLPKGKVIATFPPFVPRLRPTPLNFVP
jgi:glucose/arabinose dehydrogenase